MIRVDFPCGCVCQVLNLAYVRLTPKCTLHSVNTDEGIAARKELEKKAKEEAAQYNTLKSVKL